MNASGDAVGGLVKQKDDKIRLNTTKGEPVTLAFCDFEGKNCVRQVRPQRVVSKLARAPKQKVKCAIQTIEHARGPHTLYSFCDAYASVNETPVCDNSNRSYLKVHQWSAS